MTLPIGQTRPAMRDLRHVIPLVAAEQWYYLGLELLDPKYESLLNIIESDCKHDAQMCCRKMFSKWLETDVTPTWDKLIAAVRKVDLNNVASSIESLLQDMGGHCTSQISNAETSSGQTGNGLQSAATNVQQINNGDINTIIVQDSSEIETLDNEIVSIDEFESLDIKVAFTVLQTKLTGFLRKADFLTMRRACVTQAKAMQLHKDLMSRISMTVNVDALLDMLADSQYFSWIDIRLVETMVAASGSPQALQNFTNYKHVLFSKRVGDVLPNSIDFFSDHYAESIGKKSSDITMGDLLRRLSQRQLQDMFEAINDGILY